MVSTRVPVSSEVANRAKDLVKQFGEWFWLWRTGAKIRYKDDVELVIGRLRGYGDRNAWEAAKELRRCL